MRRTDVFSPVELRCRNDALWPIIISNRNTLFTLVYWWFSRWRGMLDVFYQNKREKKRWPSLLLNEGVPPPQFSIPMAKTYCNVAPYRHHWLGDYFGRLWSVWLLNRSLLDRALFWKYCHSLCNIYSSKGKNVPLFSSKAKNNREVLFLVIKYQHRMLL